MPSSLLRFRRAVCARQEEWASNDNRSPKDFCWSASVTLSSRFGFTVGLAVNLYRGPVTFETGFAYTQRGYKVLVLSEEIDVRHHDAELPLVVGARAALFSEKAFLRGSPVGLN